MSVANDEKIIEKIKKLLELAASPVEAEANLARKRAEELIAKYSIKLVEESDKPLEIVHVPYELKFRPPTGLLDALPYLIQDIGKQFGVYVLVKSALKQILMVGFPTNIKLVEYAIDCVLNQCMADFKREYSARRSVGFAPEFWQGVRESIHEKFVSSDSGETGLVVYDPVKNHMKAFQSGQWGFASSNASGREAGIESGQNAQIRKGVETSFQGKLLQ